MTKRDAKLILKATNALLKAEEALCSIKDKSIYEEAIREIEDVVVPRELVSAADKLSSLIEKAFPEIQWEAAQ